MLLKQQLPTEYQENFIKNTMLIQKVLNKTYFNFNLQVTGNFTISNSTITFTDLVDTNLEELFVVGMPVQLGCSTKGNDGVYEIVAVTVDTLTFDRNLLFSEDSGTLIIIDLINQLDGAFKLIDDYNSTIGAVKGVSSQSTQEASITYDSGSRRINFVTGLPFTLEGEIIAIGCGKQTRHGYDREMYKAFGNCC